MTTRNHRLRWGEATDERGAPDGWLREDGVHLSRFQTSIRIALPGNLGAYMGEVGVWEDQVETWMAAIDLLLPRVNT